MNVSQRRFGQSTFNPLMVAAIIALLYFSFTANPTERVVFLVFAGFLAIAEISRVRVRIRQRAKDNDDDTPSPNPEFQ